MASEQTGIGLIASERQRQMAEEGWDAAHDNNHKRKELVRAAACYLCDPRLDREDGVVPAAWPWSAEWWKPTPDDRVRELAKAGALIAAEIDRLLRKACVAPGSWHRGKLVSVEPRAKKRRAHK